MATPAKEQAVQELEERFSNAQALVFTDFRGLNANQMVELRQKLRAQNLEFRVVKNRLAQRAAESAGLSFDGVLEGPTAICFGYDDPVLAFKQSVTLAKEFPNYAIKGGLSEGQFLDADGVKELAELPSHEELLTQLAGAFQGPVRKLTMSLNDLLRQMVSVLDQVAQVKPESDADTAEAEAPAEESVNESVEATAAAEAEDTASDESGSAESAEEEADAEDEAQAEAAEADDEPEASTTEAEEAAETEEATEETEDDEPTEAEDAETASDADVEDNDVEDSDEDSDDKKGEST